MDKSSLSDDSLDEKPVNRSGGENPEGDADQGLPPGEAERRREDSTSVVLSEHDMRELASSISEAGLGSVTERDSPLGGLATRPDKGMGPRLDLTPLGGLPFDALAGAPVSEEISVARRVVPWILASLVAFVAGALSYWLATHLGR